jgi:hypothetical protein
MGLEDKLSKSVERCFRQKLEAERKAAKEKFAAEVKNRKLSEKEAKRVEKERKRAYNAAKKAESEVKKARN